MKISNIKSSISFSKTPMATCKLPAGENSALNSVIYNLNIYEDSDYFEELSKQPIWQEASFLWDVNCDFLYEVTGQKTYVIESDKGECLGFASVYEDDETNQNELVYIETNTKYSSYIHKRNLKYVGETLLAFSVDIAKKSGVPNFIIKHWATDPEKFYTEKCCLLSLNDNQFDDFITKNKEHSNLELIV